MQMIGYSVAAERMLLLLLFGSRHNSCLFDEKVSRLHRTRGTYREAKIVRVSEIWDDELKLESYTVNTSTSTGTGTSA